METDTIQIGPPLGRGGMANVFNGKYGAIPVALKEARNSLDALLNEAAILMKLKHPNVVQVYGIWKDRKQRVFMVGSTVVIIAFASSSAMMSKLPSLFCHVETKVLELCVNQDISLHIVKPFDEVSPLQRQQWVSQVLTPCPATTTMHTTISKNTYHPDTD